MNTYTVLLSRIDEEGNQTELIDRDIPADQAIDLMLVIKDLPEERTVAVETPDEPEPGITLKPKPNPLEAPNKRKLLCGNCGEIGHNRKTCPKAEEKEAAPKRGSTITGEDDIPWYFIEVLALLEKGKSEGEVYNEYHDTMTVKQFREAIEWANAEINS